ncbi:MAG: DUF429 domain-containing protein [Candidatus Micrarchaeota archaeon]|nr:DUF429 domain-containing protein [Candidatus Micrarchaeota archaeon]
MCKLIGIDLGISKETTAVSVLNNKKLITFLESEINNDLIQFIKENEPEIVAIDAPLSLPKGRTSIEELSNIHFRQCDLELKKSNIRFFPITIGAMRKLTSRGIHIREKLEQQGLKVVETYPGASYDLLRIKRKSTYQKIQHLDELSKKLSFNLSKDHLFNKHKLDSVYCLLSAYAYKLNKAKVFSGEDGFIVVYAGL